MDATTLQRARRGDRAAQAVLLRGLQDAWYRLCRTLLRECGYDRIETLSLGSHTAVVGLKP